MTQGKRKAKQQSTIPRRRDWMSGGISATPETAPLFRELNQDEQRAFVALAMARRTRKGEAYDVVLPLRWGRGEVRAQVVNCESVRTARREICVLSLERRAGPLAVWLARTLSRFHALQWTYELLAVTYYGSHLLESVARSGSIF